MIAALPLSGRIKVDPWNDRLQFAKSRPETPLSEAEKMPFQVAPFVFYLTRANDNATSQPANGVAAKLETSVKQK